MESTHFEKFKNKIIKNNTGAHFNVQSGVLQDATN